MPFLGEKKPASFDKSNKIYSQIDREFHQFHLKSTRNESEEKTLFSLEVEKLLINQIKMRVFILNGD